MKTIVIILLGMSLVLGSVACGGRSSNIGSGSSHIVGRWQARSTYYQVNKMVEKLENMRGVYFEHPWCEFFEDKTYNAFWGKGKWVIFYPPGVTDVNITRIRLFPSHGNPTEGTIKGDRLIMDITGYIQGQYEFKKVK